MCSSISSSNAMKNDIYIFCTRSKIKFVAEYMVFSHYNDGCLFIHILMRLVSLRQLFRGGGPCLRYNYNRSCFIDKYYSKSSQYRKKGFSFPPLVQILIPLLLLKHLQKEHSQLPGALYTGQSTAQQKNTLLKFQLHLRLQKFLSVKANK